MLAACAGPKGRISVEAFRRMWEAGEFDGRRVELLDGEVVEMSPMATPHTEALRSLTETLVERLRACHPELVLGVQIPAKVAANREMGATPPSPGFLGPADSSPPQSRASV